MAAVAVGIDTIRVVVITLGTRDTAGSVPWVRGRGLRLPGGGFAFPFGIDLFVEASLPKRQTGTNLNPLDVADLLDAVDDLLKEVHHYFDISIGPKAVRLARVNRLDLVRDFQGVQSPTSVMDYLATAPRSKTLRTARYGASSGRTTSLVVGPRKAWHGMLYDKQVESGGLAPAGHLRFEVLLRSDRLEQNWAVKNGGKVKVVGDITETKAEGLARAAFCAVGFDTAFSNEQDLVTGVWKAPELCSDRERAMLCGLLLAESRGQVVDVDRKTRRRYLDVALANGLALPVASVAGRLDWDTGTLV